MPKEKFTELFNDLTVNNFWCYQGDEPNAIYSLVREFLNIRFARKNEIFPNIEFIPINKSKKAQWFEFTHPQKIRIKNFEFKIPPIEFEILYKELILGNKKDLEDAKHLRTFFSEIVKEENFINFKSIIKTEKK